MLRAVLLGLLSISAVACKSKPESSASSQPGAVAGKVLEAKGTVSVKHGDATQPLAVGATVEADDTVITGADSSVAIELAHNSARWELGANKQQKVRDSIAWNATKATAEESGQATAAAGRPAERSAAGTSATAEDMAPPAAEPVAAPAPSPEAEPAKAPPPRATSRRERAAAPSRAAVMAPTAPAPETEKADEAAEEEAPRRTRGAIMKKEAAPADTGGAPAAAAAPAPPPPPPSNITAKAAPAPGGPSARPPGDLLAAKATQLKACLKSHTDPVTLTVVGDGGAPSVTLKSKSAISAELESCMKNVVKSVAFGDGSFTVSLRIAP